MITSISKQFLLFAINEKGKLSSTRNHKVLFVAVCFIELLYKNYIVIKDKKIYIQREITDEIIYLKPLYNYIENSKPLNAIRIIEDYTYNLKIKNNDFNELYNNIFKSLYEECNPNMKEQFYENEKKRLIGEMKEYNKFSSINDKSIVILSLALLKGYLLKEYFTNQEISNLRKVLKSLKKEEDIKIILEVTKIDIVSLLLSSISI